MRRIDWVVERKWAPVLEGSPAINEVIPFDRRSALGAFDCVRRLRQNKYTCAIDFQGLYKSSVLALLSGAPRRIGFDRGWAREGGAALLYTERVTPTGRHVAELNYSLAEKAGAIASAETRISTARPGRRRGVGPGATGGSGHRRIHRRGTGRKLAREMLACGALWRVLP